ncbi:hypothetical protein C8R46DRAFT_1217101 [Mycena filopes]|nr:hypothetical protein C8R46DRAFT_1217101 [Mycena filopes]
MDDGDLRRRIPDIIPEEFRCPKLHCLPFTIRVPLPVLHFVTELTLFLPDLRYHLCAAARTSGFPRYFYHGGISCPFFTSLANS